MKSVKSSSAPRLYISQCLRQGSEIALPEAARAHAAALRLKAGWAVRLFDGSGGEYAAVLVQDGRKLRASIGTFTNASLESPLRVRLAQCLSSGDRMDITLQKATELGVTAIQPLQSERSIIHLDDERMARRHAQPRPHGRDRVLCRRSALCFFRAICRLRRPTAQQSAVRGCPRPAHQS